MTPPNQWLTFSATERFQPPKETPFPPASPLKYMPPAKTSTVGVSCAAAGATPANTNATTIAILRIPMPPGNPSRACSASRSLPRRDRRPSPPIERRYTRQTSPLLSPHQFTFSVAEVLLLTVPEVPEIEIV